MKKKIFYSIIILITGIIVGRNIYLSKTTQTFSNKDIYYFIQEGVYSSKSIMEENIKNMDLKVVDEIDNKYYVYLGITKDELIAKRLKEIYGIDYFEKTGALYDIKITLLKDRVRSDKVDYYRYDR